MSEWFIGSEGLAKAAKVTVRQLQWWDEHALVSPVIESRKRLYSYELATLAVIISELRRCKVTLNQIRKSLDSLKRELRREHKRLMDCYLTLEPVNGVVIVSPHSAAIIAALVASRKRMWVIELGKAVARLDTCLTVDKEKA